MFWRVLDWRAPWLAPYVEVARPVIARLESGYRSAAIRLREARNKIARKLERQVEAELSSLAMKGTRFRIAVTDAAPSASGLDAVEFLVAANVGEDLRPLDKVASGGELSRISLAIQVAASHAARVPTLIFDEVDSGIGGRVAEIVGGLLKRLGSRHQVLCVTHLPQVAAQADQQWQVSKAVEQGVTFSHIQILKGEQRVEEIARMLGGVKITATTGAASRCWRARATPARSRSTTRPRRS
jgi:DNA repair protein RecN (Recombination protein N)